MCNHFNVIFLKTFSIIENPNLKRGLVLQTLIQKFETPRTNPPSFFIFLKALIKGQT